MNKRMLITSTDSMMYLFLLPHIERLKSDGWSIDIAISFAAGYEEQNYFEKIVDNVGPDVHCYTISSTRSPFSLANIKAYRELKKILRIKDYDLIWTNEPVMGFLTRLASVGVRRNGTRVLYLVHGLHFFKGSKIANWIFLPIEFLGSLLCDIIVTINRADTAFLKKYFFTPVSMINGIGFDWGRFANKKIDRRRIRTDLNLEENNFFLFAVGELMERKNHEVLIRSLSILNDARIHLYICGAGELLNFLEDLSVQLGVAENVHFLGHREDIDTLLKAADIFVHPSTREGLGIAALEAMASGLPIITSDAQGIVDYSVDGITGFVHKPHDHLGFARSIKTLLDDGIMRVKMGEHNKHASNVYSFESSYQGLEKILSGIIRNPR